jgi:hypothetical protein
MGAFSTKTIRVQTSDGHFFVLLESFSYTADDGTVYVVPAGTVTDGCSSPRILWPFVAPFGFPFLSAVLHDFLYSGSGVPKARCDELFHEAMLSVGVTRLTAAVLYAAVRYFGWRDFRLDRRK